MQIDEQIASRVRHIEIATRRMVNDSMAGEYHSVFKGRGMEFDEVRPYTEGDDVRSIDWNVTARSGFPHVKRFVEERELTVLLAVDASGSLDFGSNRQMKGELATEICALLSFAAVRNNDRVGLVVFTDQIELYIPPKRGRRHVLRVVRDLLYFKPTRRGTDIAGALEFIRRVQRRSAVVFLISDLLQNNLRTPLQLVARRHDLVTVAISDRRESALPAAGIIAMRDAETGEVAFVDTSSRRTREAYAEARRRERQDREDLLRRLGIDFVELKTGEDYLPPLIELFRKRAKRP